MQLKISSRVLDGVTVLDLDGRVVIGAEADALDQRIQDAARAGSRKVLVNLDRVIQLDSSGICSIVHGFSTLEKLGGSLRLLKPRGHVREVLEVMRLTDTIPTIYEEPQAIRSFGSAKPAGQ